jgi:pimeloyl-ACP methyl ester carboxylesterase
LLIHGGGTNALMWMPLAPYLTDDFHVYAVDNPDQPNRSMGIRPFLDIQEYVSFISEVIDALGLSRPYVAGLSQGGWISLNLALSAPERVSKLVCMAPVFGLYPPRPALLRSTLLVGLLPTHRRVRKYLNLYTASAGHADSHLFESYIEMVYRMLKCYRFPRTMMKHPLLTEEQLHRIGCPTIIMVGEREIIYDPVEALERAKRNIPGVRTILVPEAGHSLHYDRPAEIADVMRGFLLGDGGPQHL